MEGQSLQTVPCCVCNINVYIITVNTTSNIGISSMKTIDVNIHLYLMYLIQTYVLHVSTISSGHHRAPMNITQVIKIVGQIRIRILATDGCVAKEYMFIY
jgi:hypothetical protein